MTKFFGGDGRGSTLHDDYAAGAIGNRAASSICAGRQRCCERLQSPVSPAR